MNTLSARLKTVFDLIESGACVADIGTDHAFLPIALIKSGKAKRVIACDIREKPLENARKNLERTNVASVELRLSDGLQNVKANEVDTVVIAGMGGEVISGIMQRCDFIKNDAYSLILQPMTAADSLRKFLIQNGFEIKREIAVDDNSKLYTVILAQFCGKTQPCPDAFFIHGKLNPKNQTDLLYLKKQQRILEKCIADLEASAEKKEFYLKTKELLNELTRYIEVN
jgi:tRNA (adenine22-N1)-methyltransferase